MSEDDICLNTGVSHGECPCMWCHPPVFYFKQMITKYHYKTITDVIKALKDRLEYFRHLKEEGFILMGPVDDAWAEFEPPDSDTHYWVECRSSGCHLKFPFGERPPDQCPECGKNLYEYEG